MPTSLPTRCVGTSEGRGIRPAPTSEVAGAISLAPPWQADPLTPGGSAVASCLAAGFLLWAAAAPAAAQIGGGEGVNEIVVTGTRAAALRPVRSIDNEGLRAFGASTVSELLNEVMDENGDGGEMITILVDGKRVTGLGDIDSYPAEALARIDILPRENGASVGAPAGSRVYNIVLKPLTQLGVVRARARAATEGGTSGATVDLAATRIRRPQRLNLALVMRRDSALLESERRVTGPDGSPSDLGRFRTLRPGTEGADLTFSGADRLGGWLDGLVTLKISEERSRSRFGLGEDGLGIIRRSRRRAIDLAGQLTAQAGAWQAVLDGSYRRERRGIVTEPGSDRPGATTLSTLSSLDLLAFGPLLDLGAGPLTLSLGANVRRDQFGGRGSNGPSPRFVGNASEVRAGIDVPLLPFPGPLAALGSMNLRAEVRRGRADGAAVSGRSLSLRWAPRAWLDLSASETLSRTPPGAELLGEPLLETAGVRFFDPQRFETVAVVTVTGGLGGLPSQSSRMRRLAADLRPIPKRDLLLTAEYTTTHSRNVLTGLPLASAEVIRLFPDRFQRDASGRLTQVDLRPVVFPSLREEQLRLGANLTLPLRRTSNAPRLQVAGSFRLLLRSRLDTDFPEGPIDLLSRSASALGGMRPRHQVDMSIGYSERGLGVRLTGERRSGSFLDASGGAGLLLFEPLATFSLRAFVDGARLAGISPLLAGSRFGLAINNLGNDRERVRDARGETPLAFQPVLRDGVGRSIELEFRKTF